MWQVYDFHTGRVLALYRTQWQAEIRAIGEALKTGHLISVGTRTGGQTLWVDRHHITRQGGDYTPHHWWERP